MEAGVEIFNASGLEDPKEFSGEVPRDLVYMGEPSDGSPNLANSLLRVFSGDVGDGEILEP